MPERETMVIGTTDHALLVGPAGGQAWVPLDPVEWEAISRMVAATPGKELRGLVYLKLESIVGNLPTVLSVYVCLREGATPTAQTLHHVGNIGLYGLRQQNREHPTGEGMSFSLDATQCFQKMCAKGIPCPGVILVKIQSYRPMPSQAQISILKLSLVRVLDE